MIYVVIVCAVLLTAAGTAAIVRAERGPSMLDRTVAFDVFTTTLVAAVALEAAWSRRTDTLPLLVVLSLVGFVGSVTISRFAAVEPEDAARVRTREEVEAERVARRAAEVAAVEAERARREAARHADEGDRDEDAHDEIEPGHPMGPLAGGRDAAAREVPARDSSGLPPGRDSSGLPPARDPSSPPPPPDQDGAR